MEQRTPRIVIYSHYLIFITLFLCGLIIGKPFLYPIALAILFAYLLFPMANQFEKWHFPRLIATLLSVILALIFVGFTIFILYRQIQLMITDMPSLKHQALSNIDKIFAFIQHHFGVKEENQRVFLKNSIAGIFDTGSVFMRSLFKTTTGTLIKVILLPVFVFCMLYYRDKWHQFIVEVSRRRIPFINRVLQKISIIVGRYITGIFIVVLILCFLNSIGLYIIGLKYAIALGIIASICNFIPYFGPVIGYSFPLAFALITGDSPYAAFTVIILYFIIHFIENYILIPNIVGGNVRLNPFVIILSLIFAALVWGIPGMIVIVPSIAALKIFCESIESLKPYAFLLGAEKQSTGGFTIANLRNKFKKLQKR